MNRIKITTTDARLEITTRRANMVIQQPRPRLTISKQPAAMRLSKKIPQFDRNLAQFQASYGIKTSGRFSADNAAESKAIGTEFIGQIASEGDQIMDSVITGQNAIAEIPAQRIQQEIPDINVKSVPDEPINLDWTDGQFEIEWTDPSMDVDWDISVRAKIDVEAHSVEVKLRQYPEIKITVEQKTDTHPVGRKLDKKI